MTGLQKTYSKCAKGRFIPRNINKYNGDASKIKYRSGLELSAFRWFDNHPSILSWASETVIIPYYYKKSRRYIIDIWAMVKHSDGSSGQFLIEIKHSSKLKPPKPSRSKYYNSLVEEYNINQAKWDEAKVYAKNRGMRFKVLTEKTVQGK